MVLVAGSSDPPPPKKKARQNFRRKQLYKANRSGILGTVQCLGTLAPESVAAEGEVDAATAQQGTASLGKGSGVGGFGLGSGGGIGNRVALSFESSTLEDYLVKYRLSFSLYI